MLVYALYDDQRNRYLHEVRKGLNSYRIDEADKLIFEPSSDEYGYIEIIEEFPLTKEKLLEAIDDEYFRKETLILLYRDSDFSYFDLNDDYDFENLLDQIPTISNELF